MRVFDNGCFYSVMVSRAEVEHFKSRWPCSTLPDSSITFQFQKRNDDLVDILPYRIASRVDGADAVALSDDAQRYGRKRLEAKSKQA